MQEGESIPEISSRIIQTMKNFLKRAMGGPVN